MIPWCRGKPVTWDITVPNTHTESNTVDTATEAGATANQTVANKSPSTGWPKKLSHYKMIKKSY